LIWEKLISIEVKAGHRALSKGGFSALVYPKMLSDSTAIFDLYQSLKAFNQNIVPITSYLLNSVLIKHILI
jgi:hypothetical protein